jgi:hypothetical protein
MDCMVSKRKRKHLRRGARLPYVDSATFDERKLTHYALDPTNRSGKAAGFQAFGVGPEDWRYVYEHVLQELPTAEATRADISKADRVEFTVEIPFTGLNSRLGILVTGWCLDARKAPWLSTIYVKPD